MERHERGENGRCTPSLFDLTVIALAKSIDTAIASNLSHLPAELSERLLRSLSAQGLLTNSSLLRVASPHLKTLEVENVRQREGHPDAVGISCALDVCTSLEELNCSSCALDQSVMERIHSSPLSSTLRSLNLSSCSGVTVLDVQKILLSCTSLESLSLAGTTIPADAFSDAVPFASKTTSFSLKRKFDDDPASELREATALDNPTKRTRCMDPSTGISFVKGNLSALPQSSREYRQHPLRSLNISGCSQITSAGLYVLSQRFPILTHLDCSHVDAIDSLDIRPILYNCRYIKSLNINGCRIDQSNSFLSNPSLALHELSFCGSGVLNRNFYDLLEHNAASLCVLRLRNKTFRFEEDGNNEANVSPEWLQRFQSLVVLDLYSVSMGEMALPLAFSPSSRATLEELDVTHCNLSERDLATLSQCYLPALRSLSLNNVSIVNHMIDLGPNCPNLRHLCLNLDIKNLLAEADVPRLLTSLDRLEILELWCCHALSLSTVASILNLCPYLQSLLLSVARSDKVPDNEIVEAWSNSESEEEDENFDEVPSPLQSPNSSSWLSDEEFEELKWKHPNVEFKIWNHTITGNRNFLYHDGGAREGRKRVEQELATEPVSELGVRLKREMREDGSQEIVPMVLVDNIPIWSNERALSLPHLSKTADPSDGGALPLISEWCCECNIESYNGVLFYHNEDHVIWETHEPGTKRRYKFSTDQYNQAVNNARLQYMHLAWELRQQWKQ